MAQDYFQMGANFDKDLSTGNTVVFEHNKVVINIDIDNVSIWSRCKLLYYVFILFVSICICSLCPHNFPPIFSIFICHFSKLNIRASHIALLILVIILNNNSDQLELFMFKYLCKYCINFLSLILNSRKFIEKQKQLDFCWIC